MSNNNTQVLIEAVDTGSIEYLKEDVNGVTSYYIKGIFAQSNKKNRNGRVYPRPLLVREVSEYNKNYINPNRAYSELGHPTGLQINLDRVSHMIKELKQDGDTFYGKAKILDTPYGKIVKNFIDEQAKLGVSTRGAGSLKMDNGVNVVQDDFKMVAIDIVADPSGIDCWVSGIMEGKMDFITEDEDTMGWYKSRINQLVRENADSSAREEKFLGVFENYIKRLQGN